MEIDEKSARAALRASWQRLQRGGFYLFVILITLYWVGHFLRVANLVSELGFDRVYQGGGIGALWWEALKAIALVAVIRFGGAALLRRFNTPFEERGALVAAKLLNEPSGVVSRLGSSLAFLWPLERLFAFFIPTKLVNFEFTFGKEVVTFQLAALYDDEIIVDGPQGAWVLVDPDNPSRRPWLCRRREG